MSEGGTGVGNAAGADGSADDTTDASDADEGSDTDFEPAPEADDDFFAVVRTDYLRELCAVHEHVEGDAAFVVREGVGLKARSRSADCYWFEVEIPADAFDRFQVEDVDLTVDVDALQVTVEATRADRVALHGKADGTVLLRDGDEAYDLRAGDVPLDDQWDVREDDETGEAWRKPDRIEEPSLGAVEFTIPAATLQGLIEADNVHDHAGLTADLVQASVEVYFFDADDDAKTVGLTLSGEDFVDPPTHTDPWDPTDGTSYSTPICRASIGQAVAPMRGEVTVTVPATRGQTHFQYARADGDLPVYGYVSYKERAVDAFEIVRPDPRGLG